MAPELRLGIAGIGVASTLVLPYMSQIANKVRLTAVADVRKDALAAFASKYGVLTFDSVEALCASPEVDAVWIATPNHLHVEHTIIAAEHGKHVICEKPMAITLEQCHAMIEAVTRNNIKYVQGHSKVYDMPIRKAKEIIKSGKIGRVTSIHTWNFNDWITRPLVESEVDTDKGSGVVFRQGPHQVDMVRYLAGGMGESVRASAGRWAPGFEKTEGNYSAFLEFQNGIHATMVFQGYGFFDITELTWGIGESGYTYDSFGLKPHVRPSGPISPEVKYAMAEAGNPYGSKHRLNASVPRKAPFFGLTVITCEHGVIRQSPEGLYVYSEAGREEIECMAHQGRATEMLELYDAVAEDREPILNAQWGRATLEVCVSMLHSSQMKKEIWLQYQTPVQDVPGW